MKPIRSLGAVVALVVAAGVPTSGYAAAATAPAHARASAHCSLPSFGPGAFYHPTIDPNSFSPHVTNVWMPLRPGTTFLYSGSKDGRRALDVVTVSRRTLKVDGVVTRVVNDRLFLDGVLHERTSDYYAQDRCGNVWYFGEDTAELDSRGRVVSREGSFRAGVDGAQPGVFMQRRAQIGRQFRQEWYAGQAEDRYRALSTSATVRVRYVASTHALRTEERTDLEPGVVDNKYYVRGIGEVSEAAVRGGSERLELVDVLR